MVVKAKDMLEELLTNIQTGDFMKAQLVISHLDEVDDKSRRKILYALSRADIVFKVPLLIYLLNVEKDEKEQAFLKDMIFTSVKAYPESLATLIVSDRVADVRILIDAAQQIGCKKLADPLMQRLAESTTRSEMAAILDSLGGLRSEESIPVIKEFLYSGNRELVIAAVRGLGKTKSPLAVAALSERMHTDNELDIEILQQFANIQDTESIEQLCNAVSSKDAFLRTYAKKELTAIGSVAVPQIIERLQSKNTDLVIHSLNVLGDIADRRSIDPIRHLLDTLPSNANVRFAAYEAFSFLPVSKGKAAYTLTAGLSDPDDQVCHAAARAVEQNYSDILVDGLKNLLKGRPEDVAKIVRSILDTEADRIVAALVSEQVFVKHATTYLRTAHPDIRKRYYETFMKFGNVDLAQDLVGEKKTPQRAKIVAVDDSRMILSIYKSSLYELGYEPVLFEFPESALKWLEKEKPLAVLTDLNMPEITGIELAAKTREIYPQSVLPIMMVTTQNEQQDNQNAEKAGIDRILHKPFTTQSLGEAITKLLGAS